MKKIVDFTTNAEEKLEKIEYHESILPPLLSMKEVCDYLGLGQTVVTDMINKGEIPATKARNRIRVFATDLRAYLESRRIDKDKRGA